MLDNYFLTNQFKQYLELHNRTKMTIRGHRHYLQQFFNFMKSYAIDDIQAITQEHLKEYQKYRYYFTNRYGRQDSIESQNHHLSTIKCFFYFLKAEGYIIHNPAEALEYAKEPKKLPKGTLNYSQAKKILAQPDPHALHGYRDRTILEVLYSTGIRKSELMNLKLEDVDYMDGYLRVNLGKGQKDRVTPIGRIACQYLESYIKGIRPLFLNAKKEPYLFLSLRGNQLSKNALGELVSKYAKQSGIEKQITTHTFRRSCATAMIKNKANLMYVKDLLGHSSMESIQSYCNLSIVDLKEAHKKHHPRELEAI